ncbi:PIR protein CIR protein [Plasmodium vinckei petteri]|uniref:PIR protein CIR protein n=1 Tax=Plasmodium vinckei petteri TaxID=138298 RepID=A0A6V7SGB9_PLAVN|nr:PIR protein CIR protein [Plasmodium vinckei petteri]
MDDRVCGVLSEVDEYFNKGVVNERKFNKHSSLKNNCPYENNSNQPKCTTNNDRTSALCAYLHNKISEIDKYFKDGVNSDKRHIEIFIIWLGDKLFKMDNDYKATLEESYKKNLENHVGNYNYWKVMDSRKFYKKATIKKMSEYYNLINYICKLITEYNKNPDNPRLGNYSSQCGNYYKTIYNSINGCKPYLQLLDDLKMVYEIFRMQKISNNYNINENKRKRLLNRVKSLTTFQNVNQYFVTVNPILSFDDKECVDVKSKDEKIGKSIASKNLQNKPKGTEPTKKTDTGPQKKSSPGTPQGKPPLPAPANPAPAQTAGGKSTQPQPPPASSLQTSQKSETSHQSGANGSDSKKGNKGDRSNVSGGVVSRPESSEGKPKDAEQKKPNPVGTPSPGPKEGSQPTGLKNQGSGKDGHVVKGSQGGSSSGIDGGRGSVQGDQGKSDNQAKHSGDSSHGNSAPASSGAGTLPSSHPVPSPPVQPPDPQKPGLPPQPDPPLSGTPPSSVQLPSASQPLSPTVSQPLSPAVQQPGSSLQPLDPQKPGPQPPTPDPPPAQDGSSSQTSQTGGSNHSNEPKDSGNGKGSTGGTNDNTGGSSSGNENPGGGSNGPTSSTSGGSFNLGSSIFKFLLNGAENLKKTSEFIKDNQQKFKDAAEKISGAYNKAKDNLKNAYNVSNDYLNKYVNNIIEQLDKIDTPKSGDKQSGPGIPMSGGNKSNQPPPNPPSIDPSSNSLPTPPPKSPPTAPTDPTLQKQPSPQSQPIIQQTHQIDPSKHKTTSNKFVQLTKSLSSDLILKKPWNIFPTTWNGSGDCKPEIKFMNATLVCCTSEQCNLTGILITFVLIPIILLIAYKYLSFGLSKKSEKKNMKKVINFHDGNRKTKIIISSYDKKKKLKPVINSVGGKKGPLLNIYKLIRADPMPFINLFFLLIFFVYKRKRDTIE